MVSLPHTHMNVSAFDIWVVIYKNWTSDQMTWDMHRNDVGHAYIHADDAKKVIYIYVDQQVEAQRKMGTVHFHRVATQGGDERRVRERRGQHERGL